MYSQIKTLLLDSFDSIDLENVTFGNVAYDADQNANQNGVQIENFDQDRKTFIDKVMQLYLKHNLTLTCLEDVMELLNYNREPCDKFPTSKKPIIRLFRDQRDLFDVFFIMKCENKKCNFSNKIDSTSSKSKCGRCGLNLKPTESNFFVFIPIEQQIIKSVKDNWSYICKFDTSSKDDNAYSDVHDGKILKDLLEEYKDSDVNILSLTLNLDGANKFKSNVYSVWPLQLIQNYLPPRIRFLPDNIITCGLYYDMKKPNCLEYMLPLVNELDTLGEGKIAIDINGEDYIFKPAVTCCSVDLPAKSLIQQTKQFGGYDACTYCDIVGELVTVTKKPNNDKTCKNINKEQRSSPSSTSENKPKKFVRYTETDEPCKLRDIEEMLKTMLAVAESEYDEAVNGVKDISCLVKLEHFNILYSMAVDYMHGCLLGVQKRLLNFFFNSRYNGKDFYISPIKRKSLNSKLLAIRPTSCITRKPRSLDQRKNFKASEFRSLLLYYLPVILPGSIPKVYIDHVRQLSAAVYTLLKIKISHTEVDQTETMLHKFVRDHQHLFGKESMVMVVHLLKHLSDTVRNLGPLWCNSTFPFERNNGCLLKLINGTTDVLHQISSKYTLSKSLPKEFKKAESKMFLGKSCEIVETSLEFECVDSSEKFIYSNATLSVYKRIKLNNVIFTSLLYTRPRRTIDYFIGLKDETTIGMARFYFQHKGKSYVLIEKFEIIDNIYHIAKVFKTDQNILAPIEHINKKFIFMKVGVNQYITLQPNPYENE